MIADLINKDRQGFLDLWKRCKVSYIYAFGSSIRSDLREDSDVDVLVDVKAMDDLEAGGALLDLWDGLEFFFKRPVGPVDPTILAQPLLDLGDRTDQEAYL